MKHTSHTRLFRRQEGVVHLDVIVVALILLVAVGFVGYRVVSQRSASTATPQTASSGSVTVDSLQQDKNDIDSAMNGTSAAKSTAATGDAKPDISN